MNHEYRRYYGMVSYHIIDILSVYSTIATIYYGIWYGITSYLGFLFLHLYLLTSLCMYNEVLYLESDDTVHHPDMYQEALDRLIPLHKSKSTLVVSDIHC